MTVVRLICLGHMATSERTSPDTCVHEADSQHVYTFKNVGLIDVEYFV